MLKKIDKRYLGIVLPLIILCVLLYNAYFIVLFGDVITLKTVPFDPRDLFRGDYVQLTYEIEEAEESQVIGDIFNEKEGRYRRHDMYAVLKAEGDVYVLDVLTGVKPKDGIYLKCEVYSNYLDKVRVDYNINRYYVKEGTGTELETAARNGQLLGEIRVHKGRGVLVDIIKENE